ncbi:MAG: nucleotidyl transferase AbiEii/AbiGii toxin family protein [Lachnospiraceae bacterium]|nr:nucleotidyl transferase AbiEii/AbiGii toxin family protein [Lachnospiraceae bacterium]
MFLHNDSSFPDIIEAVSSQAGIANAIVEKDYYVTMVLKGLSERSSDIVFKGGTSLSKAYHVINRFSEDIDITFNAHIGEARRKKLKYEVIEKTCEELGLVIRNWKKTESDKDYNRYEIEYKSIVDADLPIAPMVVLETALMTCAFPTVAKSIENIIYDCLKDSDIALLSKYGLIPFSMQVQAMERTLADKLFAICDYYMLGRSKRCSRHLYDVYKLRSHVTVDQEFLDLIKEVRIVRQSLGLKTAPAASNDVDIVTKTHELRDEEFYREDYERTTRGLISDEISYEDAMKAYEELIENVF